MSAWVTGACAASATSMGDGMNLREKSNAKGRMTMEPKPTMSEVVQEVVGGVAFLLLLAAACWFFLVIL